MQLSWTLKGTDGLYGLPCTFYDSTIDTLFTNGDITSNDACTAGKTVVSTACVNSGLSSWVASACAAGLPAEFYSDCTTAVAATGAYTKDEVQTAVGCAADALQAPSKLAFE